MREMGSSRGDFLRKQYLSWDSWDYELAWWYSGWNLWLQCPIKGTILGEKKQKTKNHQDGFLEPECSQEPCCLGALFQCEKFVSTWEVLSTNSDCVTTDCLSPTPQIILSAIYDTVAWKDFRVSLKGLGHWFLYLLGLQNPLIRIVDIFI